MSVNQIADITIAEDQQRLGKVVTKVYKPVEPGEVYTLESVYSRKRAS